MIRIETPTVETHASLPATIDGLPAIVDRAASALAGARTAAEVLEARELAGMAYDAAKRAARFGQIRGAHDTLVAAAHRAQADALEIEARAKRRLADEYDAAQDRGEIASGSVRTDIVPNGNDVRPATAAEIGLTRQQVHEARKIRDAEEAEPGIVRKVLDEKLAAKEEPTRAAVKVATAGHKKKKAKSRINPHEDAERSDREENMRIRSRVYGEVRDALKALTGLPRPRDVVPMVRALARNGQIDDRLGPALDWLMEFSDAWHESS